MLLVGDFTATVGDPTGRNQSRPLLTSEEAARNAQTYLSQALLILRPDRLEVVHNSEHLSALTLPQLLGYASAITVSGLLERSDFAARLSAGRPISVSEFIYPLLQGIDSVAVRADVELGGSDQLFNLMVGRTLQKAAGQAPQAVLTVPILEGLDGSVKMSKSAGNFIALTEPASSQFGKVMSIPDALLPRYAQLCLGAPEGEVSRIESIVAAGGSAVASAKRDVAEGIAALYHGPQEAAEARAQFDLLFKAREVPTSAVPADLAPGDPVFLPAFLTDANLAQSRSKARALIDAGAVRIDGQKAPAGQYEVPRARLAGKVVQVGHAPAVRAMG